MVLVDMPSGSGGKRSSVVSLCVIVLSIGLLCSCEGKNLKLWKRPEKDSYALHQYPLVRNLLSVDHGSDFDLLGAEKSNGKVRERRQVKEPVINSVEPKLGQVIGNLLHIFGDNFMQFGGGEVVVKIGDDTPCSCPPTIKSLPNCYNNTYLVCLYTNSTGSLDTPLPVTIEDENGTIYTGQNVNYTFKENVVILDAKPLKTIFRGGTRMTITGENFHPQFTTSIKLTTYTSGRVYGINMKECNILNDTSALCITPRVPVPNSLFSGTRRKRQTTTVCRTEASFLNVRIAFRVVLVETNFTQTDGTNDLCVTEDPELKDYENDIYEFKIYDGENQLQIEGNRLNYGVHRDDYQVFVGNSTCNITRLESNILSCVPPQKVPTDIPDKFQRNGLPMLRVLIGQQLSLAPAYIDYQFEKPIDINVGAIVGGVLGGLLAILVGIIICWQCRKKGQARRMLEREDQDYTRLMQQEDRSLLDLLDDDLRNLIMDCSLKSHKLTRNKEIGSGHYGKVFIGTLAHEEQPKLREKTVAVKTIKDDGVSLTQIREFLSEATLMKDLKHPNVLHLIGILLEDNKPYVVLPLMEKGDLKSYVSNEKNKFKVADLIKICTQVAKGMAFLAEQKIIHRDLRAVNCLVNKNAVVKIADFGLSRDIYGDDYYRVNDRERALPVKWMAPEALEGRDVTSALDVWSYGVLMWEVFTRGLSPYADVPNHDMKKYILMGRRLEKPQFCTLDVYEVMLSCWEGNPKSRKTFKEIVEILTGFIQPTEPPATTTNKENANEEETTPNHNSTDIGSFHKPLAPSDSYFVPRASTNEYIKAPGLVNDYLVVIGDDQNPAPIEHSSNAGKVYDVPANTDPALLENDGYLKPEPSRYQNVPDEKEQFVPSKNESFDLKEENNRQGSTPYFVNPPIDESYMSPVGQEKVEASLNQPRGFLYQNSSEVRDGDGDDTLYETPKAEANSNRLNSEYEKLKLASQEKTKSLDEEIPPGYNPATSDQEKAYVNQQMSKVAAKSKHADLPTTNGKVTTTQNPDSSEKEGTYINQQMSKVAANSKGAQLPKESGESVNLDVKSLVSRFAGKDDNKLYANDPDEIIT